MDKPIREIYLMEMQTQARLALRASEAIDHAIMLRQSPEATQLRSQLGVFAHDEVFRAIHSFLTHASNVSKLLWPIGNRKLNESDADFETR